MEGSQERLPTWNIGHSAVVHPQLYHKGFPVDSALVGAG